MSELEGAWFTGRVLGGILATFDPGARLYVQVLGETATGE
jgi:hypothetical protein